MFKVPEGYILIKKEEYEGLKRTILEMSNMIEKLTRRIEELESQLSKNSSNSHKPPSSDGLKKKIKNNREKSGKQQGAQPGHKGTTLQFSEQPDETISCKVEGYCECGEDLRLIPAKGIERRQTIELPKKLIKITEFQIEVKECKCGRTHKGFCTQTYRIGYGKRFKSLMVYLNQYQFIPRERLQELVRDYFGISISDGLLESICNECYNQLEATEVSIKEGLIQSLVNNFDETGIRNEGDTNWIHSCSNKQLTHYSISKKRGKEGIDEKGILSEYKGVAVHDRWKSYDGYSCEHALCNAHLLRDLKFVYEELDRQWAKEMINTLIFAKRKRDEENLTHDIIRFIEGQYNHIIDLGMQEEPVEQPSPVKKRGRKAKNKSLRLLEVFKERKIEILMFMYNMDVPFDNNLAERDLRMVKLKQKISGCFRKRESADVFCRIRSYISTIRKQGYPVLEAISATLSGNPFQVFPVIYNPPAEL